MFELLFGNSSISKSLLYLARFEEGYPTQIARNFDLPVNMIQRQLEKLERAGVLVSLNKGRTRIFTWNPRYPFKQELLALLNRAFDFMPETHIKKYYTKRTRPRRKGKP